MFRTIYFCEQDAPVMEKDGIVNIAGHTGKVVEFNDFMVKIEENTPIFQGETLVGMILGIKTNPFRETPEYFRVESYDGFKGTFVLTSIKPLREVLEMTETELCLAYVNTLENE